MAFDQDIYAKAASLSPNLRSLESLTWNVEYTHPKFWLFMIDSYLSAVVFFLPSLVWITYITISWNQMETVSTPSLILKQRYLWRSLEQRIPTLG